MKLKHFLISLVVLSSNVFATPTDVTTEISYRDQFINQAATIVERTVNIISNPFLSEKDIDCLARNIFYESGGEPTEGKIAVGIVTVNRAQDSRFGSSVCEVVKARTVVARTRQVKQTDMVQVGYFGRPEPVTSTHTVIDQVPVCQFSWVCGGFARQPKSTDERWQESRAIAEGIARGDYEEYRAKYSNALYFHSSGIRPVWAKSKKFVTRTGHHLFYE